MVTGEQIIICNCEEFYFSLEKKGKLLQTEVSSFFIFGLTFLHKKKEQKKKKKKTRKEKKTQNTPPKTQTFE